MGYVFINRSLSSIKLSFNLSYEYTFDPASTISPSLCSQFGQQSQSRTPFLAESAIQHLMLHTKSLASRVAESARRVHDRQSHLGMILRSSVAASETSRWLQDLNRRTTQEPVKQLLFDVRNGMFHSDRRAYGDVGRIAPTSELRFTIDLHGAFGKPMIAEMSAPS
jgi:hypothetical protein